MNTLKKLALIPSAVAVMSSPVLAQNVEEVCPKDTCSEIQKELVVGLREIFEDHNKVLPMINMKGYVIHQEVGGKIIQTNKEGVSFICIPSYCERLPISVEGLLKYYKELLQKMFPKIYT